MVEALEEINKSLQTSYLDIIGIFSPIVLSCIAIILTLWDSVWSKKVKGVHADLIWDDLMEDYCVLIRNTGKRDLVIKEVTLFGEGKKKSYELGKRDNVWRASENNSVLTEGNIIVIKPRYGSLYDLFAYSGHYETPEGEDAEQKVKIMVKDIEGKKWVFTSNESFNEMDKNVELSSNK